jgi:hypothetical protein
LEAVSRSQQEGSWAVRAAQTRLEFEKWVLGFAEAAPKPSADFLIHLKG